MTLGESADDAYKNLLKEVLSNEASADADLLKVVFSPIHGTGQLFQFHCLKKWGSMSIAWRNKILWMPHFQLKILLIPKMPLH